MANILCIGIPDATMETRRMILERAEHSVTTAQDLREVIAGCRSEGFAVVILSQSLPRNEKLRVMDVVRIESRNAKVLELHTDIAPELPSADAHLHIATGAPDTHECVRVFATLRDADSPRSAGRNWDSKTRSASDDGD